MPGIMQASTQHMPTKPKKAASTCTDCESKNVTSEKLNGDIRATVGSRELCIAYVARRKRISSQKRDARKYRGRGEWGGVEKFSKTRNEDFL